MTREGTRPIASLAIAILAVALLTACGGSDSSTTSETTTGSSSAEAAPEKGSSTGAEGTKEGTDGQKETGGSGSGHEGYTPKPLQVSGGGSSPFLTKGGDNSIQEYGTEGDDSELTEAAEVLHAFLVARADEDWARMCAFLAKSEVKSLEELGAQSPQLKDEGCPAVVKALAAEPLPATVKRELTEVDAASLRIEGDEAFLIYDGPNDTGYFIRMEDEGGTWKVGGISPTAFPGG